MNYKTYQQSEIYFHQLVYSDKSKLIDNDKQKLLSYNLHGPILFIGSTPQEKHIKRFKLENPECLTYTMDKEGDSSEFHIVCDFNEFIKIDKIFRCVMFDYAVVDYIKNPKIFENISSILEKNGTLYCYLGFEKVLKVFDTFKIIFEELEYIVFNKAIYTLQQLSNLKNIYNSIDNHFDVYEVDQFYPLNRQFNDKVIACINGNIKKFL
jgi:hypothetical protein